MNRNPARTSSLCLGFALIAVGLSACSSQGNGTAPGDQVVIAGTSHVVWISSGGGFSPPIPAGAACHLESSYDFDLNAGSLAWSMCKVANNNFNDSSAYSIDTGSRTLTADERAQANAAASAIKVSPVTTCGADLDSRSLEVDSTSGSITYGDDFYACSKLFEHYVFNGQLANLGGVLNGLAHSP